MLQDQVRERGEGEREMSSKKGGKEIFLIVIVTLSSKIGGLEVKTPEGEWVRVTPKAGTLILNTGDLLSKWTNGILMPTPHCVRLDKVNFIVVDVVL